MTKRVLVGFGIDVDAVSGWINTKDGSAANPTDVSRGVFGATVGIDRLLKLFDKFGIKATWFVPAHSIESFPEQLAKVRNTDHEIGLHGYTHEHVGSLSESQERDVLAKSIDVLKTFTGKQPRGWTAPAWNTSNNTVRLLEEHGIEYDHSFMYHDCQMYYLPSSEEKWEVTNLEKDAETWMKPMSSLKESSIVEVPANWHLDDWPPFQPAPGRPGTHGFVDPDVVLKLWQSQFEYFYREYDTFVFPISIHPQVSGKPQVILMHEKMITWISSHEGVEWCTMEKMVEEFKSGRFAGVTVKGGVADQ